MAALIWIVVVVVVVVVVALVAVGARRRRTAVLRDRFGPEYDRAVENSDDQRAARPAFASVKGSGLSSTCGRCRKPTGCATRGSGVTCRSASSTAGRGRSRRRRARHPRHGGAGYPVTDFGAQADLVSVDHPGTVEDYRFAHAVQQRSGTEQASTEDLREALLRYRSLFDELLRPEGNGATGTAEGRRERVTGQPEAQAAEASAARQLDDPEAGESGTLAGPTAPDTDYHDQQIGR